MKEAISKVTQGMDLTVEETKRAMNIMLSGEATQAQIGAFLTALRMKGETIDEIVGAATVVREKAEHIAPIVKDGRFVDCVGTGGDGYATFNISTTTSFVVAAAGLPVAKHGNRAFSSKSGAADVLEALGVNIILPPERVEKSVEEVGIGFMFAQTFNKSMKHVGQARGEIGIRTIFNVLGPLSNPSGSKYQLVGVYNSMLTEPLAKAMSKMGVVSAMVVSGEGGMDEISLSCPTFVSEIKDGEVKSYQITPEQFGFKTVDYKEIQGGDAKENAQITRDILSGQKGAKRDIVLFNAGATLYVGKVVPTIEEGIKLAAETIDSGKAMEKLSQLIAFNA